MSNENTSFILEITCKVELSDNKNCNLILILKYNNNYLLFMQLLNIFLPTFVSTADKGSSNK